MPANRRDGRDLVGALGAPDVLLLAAVVALPWFWGGVGLDAYRTASALVALAAGWALIRHGPSGLGLGRRALWLLPAFLLGAWAFLQTVPLPRAWVAVLSPKAASLQANAFGPEGLGGAAWLRQIEKDARARVPEAASVIEERAFALDLGTEAPSPPRHFTLSLLPDATLERAFWYTALLAAFLVAHRRTADERRAAVYRAALFVLFGVLAAVGILGHVTAPSQLLWLRAAPVSTRPFGPYVNPSHFAGVMELAAPWLLGYGLAPIVKRGAPERMGTRRVLALAGAGLTATAAALAASKMAAMTIGIASLAVLAVAIGAGRGRRRSILLAGIAAAAVVLGAIGTYGPLRGRLADFEAVHEGALSTNVRGLAWSAGLRMAGDYTLTGSGFGAFSEIIPNYLPRGESDDWYQLHNDYLEVYLAGGLVAAVLTTWLAAAFVVRLARVVRSESAPDRILASLGLALGLLALALHEAVDFNLQVPANALLFVVIAAMGVSPLARWVESP